MHRSFVYDGDAGLGQPLPNQRNTLTGVPAARKGRGFEAILASLPTAAQRGAQQICVERLEILARRDALLRRTQDGHPRPSVLDDLESSLGANTSALRRLVGPHMVPHILAALDRPDIVEQLRSSIPSEESVRASPPGGLSADDASRLWRRRVAGLPAGYGPGGPAGGPGMGSSPPRSPRSQSSGHGLSPRSQGSGFVDHDSPTRTGHTSVLNELNRQAADPLAGLSYYQRQQMRLGKGRRGSTGVAGAWESIWAEGQPQGTDVPEGIDAAPTLPVEVAPAAMTSGTVTAAPAPGPSSGIEDAADELAGLEAMLLKSIAIIQQSQADGVDDGSSAAGVAANPPATTTNIQASAAGWQQPRPKDAWQQVLAPGDTRPTAGTAAAPASASVAPSAAPAASRAGSPTRTGASRAVAGPAAGLASQGAAFAAPFQGSRQNGDARSVRSSYTSRMLSRAGQSGSSVGLLKLPRDTLSARRMVAAGHAGPVAAALSSLPRKTQIAARELALDVFHLHAKLAVVQTRTAEVASTAGQGQGQGAVPELQAHIEHALSTRLSQLIAVGGEPLAATLLAELSRDASSVREALALPEPDEKEEDVDGEETGIGGDATGLWRRRLGLRDVATVRKTEEPSSLVFASMPSDGILPDGSRAIFQKENSYQQDKESRNTTGENLSYYQRQQVRYGRGRRGSTSVAGAWASVFADAEHALRSTQGQGQDSRQAHGQVQDNTQQGEPPVMAVSDAGTVSADGTTAKQAESAGGLGPTSSTAPSATASGVPSAATSVVNGSSDMAGGPGTSPAGTSSSYAAQYAALKSVGHNGQHDQTQAQPQSTAYSPSGAYGQQAYGQQASSVYTPASVYGQQEYRQAAQGYGRMAGRPQAYGQAAQAGPAQLPYAAGGVSQYSPGRTASLQTGYSPSTAQPRSSSPNRAESIGYAALMRGGYGGSSDTARAGQTLAGAAASSYGYTGSTAADTGLSPAAYPAAATNTSAAAADSRRAVDGMLGGSSAAAAAARRAVEDLQASMAAARQRARESVLMGGASGLPTGAPAGPVYGLSPDPAPHGSSGYGAGTYATTQQLPSWQASAPQPYGTGHAALPAAISTRPLAAAGLVGGITPARPPASGRIVDDGLDGWMASADAMLQALQRQA